MNETGRYAGLSGETFDLVVVGGGVAGCGIARDAALRGLRVALFEKEDFGYGTSSRSTRLIHGGLRYLEMLDFGLVRQDLREREILLRVAPHRVAPLAFLIPFYRRSTFYRARMQAGMILYDLLSYDKSLPRHAMLSREQTLQTEPSLNPDGLQGAARYWDAQAALPERLCVDNIVDAAQHGAKIFNHTSVTGLLRDDAGRIVGISVCDTATGEVGEARAEVVVNASGPWLDRLQNQFGNDKNSGGKADAMRPVLRLTKGVHFAAPPAVSNALVLFSERDGRLFFVIPWLGYAWVGTTDTDFDGDLDAVRATGDDVRYLREAAELALPRADWNAIYYTNAGVRALVRKGDSAAHESDVSRKHRIVVYEAASGLEGLISVAGGKLTAFRDIAEQAVNAAVLARNRKWIAAAIARGVIPRVAPVPPCVTASRSLPGGDFSDSDELKRQARTEAQSLGLDDAQADHLVFLYGTRYTEILAIVRDRPERAARLAPQYPDIMAQVVHAVKSEFAGSVSDFLLRRTMLGFAPDQGLAALVEVANQMVTLLHWNRERRDSEIAGYQAQVALTQAFRAE